MDTDEKLGFDTMAIHAGGEDKNPENALNPPIFQTSTFTFDSIEQAEKAMSFESDDYVYTRGNNPTLRLFENRMAALEGGSAAVAFASGMAAISSTLFSFLKPGDNLVASNCLYGSTYTVISKFLPEYGVDCRIADMTNLERLEAIMDKNTRVVYFETPSNPSLKIIDIKKVVEIARAKGVKVVVDNTFATPYFQRPLTMGADVVVHSATKYISGHGDAVGGVAVSRDADYIHRLKFEYMCELGQVLSPFNAWLLLRGIKTLGLRMRQHEKNALKLARFLEEHPGVKSVYYPGLESFQGHETAKSQMNGFGAMLSFEVYGGIERARKVVNSVKLIKLGVSLEDCETLIELPAAMTHLGYPRERLSEFDLTESMIRISVGLENAEDLIKDMDGALAGV